MQKERQEWQSTQKEMNIENLVFLDESSINYAMTRIYGWGKKSERVVEGVPDFRFQRMSVLSSVRLNGDKNRIVFNGTLNKELFAEYLKTKLAPTLADDDIVIMDNCSVHKSKMVRQTIKELGMNVVYLPRYSPDLNPIELMWSKIKAILRKIKARCHDKLLDGLNFALDQISKSDIQNWFRHDGYIVKL